MANAYINIYKGNPTSGATDGTAVSTDGTYTAPVNATLNVSAGASEKVKLAIRCESGYTTTGNTVITVTGTNSGMWQFCTTENGTYTDSLTITSAIGAGNVIFYAKISSSSGESLSIDHSVDINIQATVTVAET